MTAGEITSTNLVSFSVQLEGTLALVQAGSRLDEDKDNMLEKTISRCLQQGSRHILVNLQGMKTVNLPKLTSLARLHEKIRLLGGELIFTGMPEFVQWYLSDIEMLERFSLAPHSEIVRLSRRNNRFDLIPEN